MQEFIMPNETLNRVGMPTGRTVTLPAVVLAVAALVLAGCGATGGKRVAPSPGAQSAGSSPVKVEDAGDLADVARGIKSDEDQYILNLMLGYRMLLLSSPDAKTLDKESLKKSRDAYDRLENILRHGGVSAKEPGERVFTITSEEKLSLQEVIHFAAEAAEKAAREGDWEKARARWKEITGSKATVALIIEEAQWGLILSEALHSALPDSIKKRLKDLNESNLADIGHEEIGKQVKALLEIVTDVKLQRELKKLANRSWERDKKAGRITAQAQQAQAAAALAGTVPPGSPIATPTDSPTAALPDPAAPTGTDPAAITAEADSLASKGKYVAALKALEKAGSEQSWVKDKKTAIGDRFCEEKRRTAANTFKDFKKAASETDKRALLKRTATELDSCLFYFPDLSVALKVRKNRDMVEGELKKLKP